MKFRTKISIDKATFDISHQDHIISMGSCFSENIGSLLFNNKFKTLINPFGVLYNPSSIASVLKRILAGDMFSKEDLVLYNNQYHSFMHHGAFSSENRDESIEKINKALVAASKGIDNTKYFLITFGSAYVFKHNKTKNVVSNCHKFPANTFTRERLSIEDIVNEWQIIINTIREQNKKAVFLFTVSPIRHWRDGAHENQLSKAILHLAIDKLEETLQDVFYFPAYELLIDDLRDYRFYADDMMHPSPTAVNYIWQKFSETYFNDETNQFIKSWSKIKKALEHRPNNENETNHTIFVQQTYDKIKNLQKQYPLINFESELKSLFKK